MAAESQLRCQEVEVLLCDYVDSTLSTDELATVDEHLASCPACSGLLADIQSVGSFLERVPDVPAPQQLVTRILHEQPGRREITEAERRFFFTPRRWLHSLIQPMLQPRLAMGMAMTVLSFSLLSRFGLPVRQLSPADLEPARVVQNLDNTAHRMWDRVVKSYESMRMVVELREWQRQQDSRARQQAPQPQNTAPETARPESH
jgi:anti-sigma factor RsiW